MNFNVNVSGIVRGLEQTNRKMKMRVNTLAKAAAKKLEGEAKNPPYPENPNAKNYTENDMVRLKSIARKASIGPLRNTEESTSSVHYRWKDRTALARQTIQGNSSWAGNDCRITVGGNVDYFIFLEFAMEKKYAVLWPTVERMYPSIMKGFYKLL